MRVKSMNNIRLYYKRTIITVLSLMMILTLSGNIAFASIGDGEYKIGLEALNTSNNAPSMADQYIKKPAKLEVESGTIYAVIVMTESDLLRDFSVMGTSGDFQLAQVVKENKAENEKTYRFKVKNLDEPLQVQTYVSAAGMTVTFRIAFDKGKLEKIESSPPQQSNPTTNPDQSNSGGSTPQSSGSNSGNTPPSTGSNNTDTKSPSNTGQATDPVEDEEDEEIEDEEIEEEGELEEEDVATIPEASGDEQGAKESNRLIYVLIPFIAAASFGGYRIYAIKIKGKS